MIDSNDISVVFQGPILYNNITNEEITKRCCQRVRELLPKAEIILSTWDGSIVDGIVYDKLVLNKDPGCSMMTLDGIERANNTNRMILSTKEGIKVATKKYLVKMRTDLYLENLDFLTKFGLYKNMGEHPTVIEKIITLSANNYKRGANIIFTVNDWFFFGLKQDVLKLWDIDLQDSDTLIKKNGQLPRFEDNLIGEDYVWTRFLSKNDYYRNQLNLIDNRVLELSEKNIDLYKRSLAENLVLYNGEQLGLNSLKLRNRNYVRRDFAKASCFTHSEWQTMYKEYIDNDFRVKSSLKDYFDILLYVLVFKVLKSKLSILYKSLKGIYNHG